MKVKLKVHFNAQLDSEMSAGVSKREDAEVNNSGFCVCVCVCQALLLFNTTAEITLYYRTC